MGVTTNYRIINIIDAMIQDLPLLNNNLPETQT
jgi:hypothetical protein